MTSRRRASARARRTDAGGKPAPGEPVSQGGKPAPHGWKPVPFYWQPAPRRGVVAVQVAVVMALLIGFAALTIDMGVIYNTRADLQRTADAAALAAAAKLSDYSNGSPVEAARAAAIEYTQRNKVFGRQLALDPASDIVFGRATYNEGTGLYDFAPTEVLPDAVRVRVRQTADSPNGAAPLFFANIFGVEDTDISAQATAMMVPRDIAIVADLSASHNDDSELKSYEFTDVNMWNVWDAWPGGYDDIDHGLWDGDDIKPEWVMPDGSVPQAAGPAWGYMKEIGFGTDPIPNDYNPAADEGLVYLPYNVNWSNAQLSGFLAEQGYSAGEVSAIMSRSYDGSGYYKYRVAVALGLAYWNSGLPGGLWEQRGAPPGNNNSVIASSELEWTAAINERSISDSRSLWLDYINSYMKSSYTEMTQANSAFRYRFGAKTFMNYFMETRFENESTPELADSPHQPMQAVKDAVAYMVDFIDELDTDDQLSLEIYGTVARHEVDLTLDIQQVKDRLDELQAGHYDGWTNMGGGLERSIEELSSVRARHASKKMIILLTDGYANVDENGNVGDYTGGPSYALNQAQAAATAGFRIFAVSVGAASNVDLMDQVAEIGQGEHFHAEGSIEEYSDELEDIFGRLGAKRPVELIE